MQLSAKYPDQHLEEQLYSDMLTSVTYPAALAALEANPADCKLRARLLLYYSTGRKGMDEDERIQLAAQQIQWLVERYPHWRFCGSRLCYLDRESPAYQKIKELWLAQCKAFDDVMVKVNAYMFLAWQDEAECERIMPEMAASQDDAECERIMAELIASHDDNVWVKALKQRKNSKKQWLEDAVMAEVALEWHPVDFSEETVSHEQEERVQQAIFEHENTITEDEYKDLKNQTEWQIDDVGRLIGFTWTKHHLNNLIQCDPEMILVLLKSTAWLVRNFPHAPKLKLWLSLSPFIKPPEQPLEPDIKCLNNAGLLLTKLMAKQVIANNHNRTILKNARFVRDNYTCAWLKRSCPELNAALKSIGKPGKARQ